MRFLPASLTRRLALLFALLTASLLVMVVLVQSTAVESHFDELADQELSGKLVLIQNLLQRRRPDADLRQQLDDALTGHDSLGVVLHDANGGVVYALRPEVVSRPQRAGQAFAGSKTDTFWEMAGRHYIGREAELAALGTTAEPTRLTAVLALDISHHVHFLEQVRRRLWVDISVAVLIAALFGLLAAHAGLAPLRGVTATARRLSADHLDERLAENDAPAEVRALVEAFNGMLERLESSFRRLSDFSADIAHELRTPVSNLMTQTEVALSQARSPEDYRDVLASNLEEYERIARMVSDMLFLAKAESGRLPHPAKTVSLGTETQALIEFYEALAEEKGVRIALAGDALVTADSLMLRRALSNLLSNAIRHTPAGGSVDISIASTAKLATLAVTNTGDTIPSDQLSQIFERFHRAGPERHRHGEGAGLGLAITRSIVTTHGGRITATSDAGVTTFSMHLPLAPSVVTPERP